MNKIYFNFWMDFGGDSQKTSLRLGVENPTTVRFLYGVSFKTGLKPEDVYCSS
jgi:Fe-S cluster assembly iron-binding protein IscA